MKRPTSFLHAVTCQCLDQTERAFAAMCFPAHLSSSSRPALPIFFKMHFTHFTFFFLRHTSNFAQINHHSLLQLAHFLEQGHPASLDYFIIVEPSVYHYIIDRPAVRVHPLPYSLSAKCKTPARTRWCDTSSKALGFYYHSPHPS